jgi:RNA polymerase sigma-70 factor (ECF subfamily)
MLDDPGTTELKALLAHDDLLGRDALLQRVGENLRRLASGMLRRFPAVARWEATDDVLQSATLRLLRALDQITPDTPRQFFALAAKMIRRELIDLVRHYQGPMGLGANHHSNGVILKNTPGTPDENIEIWTAFHESVGQLPDQEREIVDLLHYQGLAQQAAADLLGVDIRTVQRRWQQARIHLHHLAKSRDNFFSSD